MNDKMKNEPCYCEELLNDLYEGVYFVDKDRGITFWNQGAAYITGFSAEEMLGHYCYENLLNHVDDHGNQLCLCGCPLHATLNDGEPRSAQVYLHHRNGHRVRVNIRVRPMTIDQEIVGAAEIFTAAETTDCFDLSVRELERLALFDQLTQLPNRRYIDTFLENQIRDLKTLGIPFGILMMDLDFFKHVNDTYGHSVGDEMLKMVAGTFQNAMRKNDFVGRWGGEEFIAIFRGVTSVELETIAEKIRNLVARSGLKRNKEYVRVTISIGATMALPDDTAATIVHRSDQGLYTSKRTGRDRVTVL